MSDNYWYKASLKLLQLVSNEVLCYSRNHLRSFLFRPTLSKSNIYLVKLQKSRSAKNLYFWRKVNSVVSLRFSDKIIWKLNIDCTRIAFSPNVTIWKFCHQWINHAKRTFFQVKHQFQTIIKFRILCTIFSFFNTRNVNRFRKI